MTFVVAVCGCLLPLTVREFPPVQLGACRKPKLLDPKSYEEFTGLAETRLVQNYQITSA